MELTSNQRELAEAIHDLCTDPEPFTTIADIAEHVPFSKQTVLNNIGAVVENRGAIECRTIGQANVYYLKEDRADEIGTEDTMNVIRLSTENKAKYAEIRKSCDGSDFDLEVRWYSYNAVELDGYVPTNEERGEAVALFARDAVAIKL